MSIYLKTLFLDQSSMDLTLKVAGDTTRAIKVHRLIVSSASDYFKTLFESDFKEKNAHELCLQGLNFDTLSMLIRAVYTDELAFSPKCTIKDAIVSSDYLRMNGVLQKLVLFARNNITAENVLDLIRLEDKLDEELRKGCVKFLSEHIETFKDKLGGLTFNQMLLIVKHYPVERKTTDCYGRSTTRVTPPTEVLELIVAWTKAEPPKTSRYQQVARLLSAAKIRYVITPNFIAEKLLPICNTVESLKFLVALQVRQNNVRTNLVLSLTPNFGSI